MCDFEENRFENNKYDIDMHKKLTDIIKKQLGESYFKNPILPLSEKQKENLKKSDGQKRNPDEYKQGNSSAGLAINYFKILEDKGVIKDVIFEDKVAKPIKTGGRFANLDVKYTKIDDDTLYFVESKFLEPYYSLNKDNSAYVGMENVCKYDDIREIDLNKWNDLFTKANDRNNFKYYNASQLCTHLLAIYRFSKENEKQKLVLQSIIWEMPDSFIDKITNARYRNNLKVRREIIKKEEEMCKKLISEHIDSINWKNIRFETLNYNNEVERIKDSKFYDEFCRRYFLKL